MEWLGLKHALLVHLPVAAALLLPLPLLLAQRGGRGIRPWWTACRYLAWMGALGLVGGLLSGLAHAGTARIAPAGTLLRTHQIWAYVALGSAILALWAMHRPRKDHEGLGWSAFFAGTLWAFTAWGSAGTGHRLDSAGMPLPPPAPMVLPAADPEAERPVRALDYAALRPMREVPVKALDHGGRWVRTWATPEAEAAFKGGTPLPKGAFVVLSSHEDRWGRPGPEPGPLWAYSLGEDGRPTFQFYWASVPENRRTETEGQARVYWRKEAPQLRSCLDCHWNGASDPERRARPRKPTAN